MKKIKRNETFKVNISNKTKEEKVFLKNSLLCQHFFVFNKLSSAKKKNKRFTKYVYRKKNVKWRSVFVGESLKIF